MRIGRTELICDFAETYHILDIWSLPARLVATLSVGLRDNSRIIMKITGMRVPRDTLLLADCLDALHILIWKDTKDGQKGRRMPEMLGDRLRGIENDSKKKKAGDVFESPEAFEAERSRLIQKITKGE